MGDITGRYMFSHAANFESEYLANQIADNRDEPIDYGPMPHSVFTSPESAGVQGFRAPARRNTDCEKAQRYTLTRRHHLRPSLAGCTSFFLFNAKAGPRSWRDNETGGIRPRAACV